MRKSDQQWTGGSASVPHLLSGEAPLLPSILYALICLLADLVLARIIVRQAKPGQGG